jgi:hypothetical protein
MTNSRPPENEMVCFADGRPLPLIDHRFYIAILLKFRRTKFSPNEFEWQAFNHGERYLPEQEEEKVNHLKAKHNFLERP